MLVMKLIFNMLQVASLFLVIAYVISRFKFFNNFFSGKPNILSQALLILIFGGMAIYGTYSGIKAEDAIVNVRDVGPILAGLLGGPWVGLGAGLIGDIHRYFYGSAFTAIPCSLATVLSGLAAGLFYYWLKDKIGIWKPAVLTFCMQCIHMLLILAIARPFEKAVHTVSVIAAPMIIGCTICVTIFAFMLVGIRRDMRHREAQPSTQS